MDRLGQTIVRPVSKIVQITLKNNLSCMFFIKFVSNRLPNSAHFEIAQR
jgi:hypothetical protein